jgi:hypothetical protein
MTKTTTPENGSNPTKKPRKPRTEEVFDQDHAWKKFMTSNFWDCLARINPKLHAAADKSVPPVFLEQEFHNDLRGKYKVTDKEKRGDKLVKIRLLTGEDHLVFLHSEIQDQLRDNISDRICTYRILIQLRYQTHNITSVAIFTGKAPAKKHKIFISECYGSKMTYSYISFVIANQNVRKLQKSDNLFDIALLAAKYTLNTEGDEQRRLLFKQKVFEIALKKQIPLEKMEELLSFVFDYMHLSPNMENEFIAKTPFLKPINDDMMVQTRGERIIADLMQNSPLAKSVQAKMKAKMEAELRAQIRAEKEAEIRTEKEVEKQRFAAEKEVERRHTIKKLLGIGFSAEKIADVLDFDLVFVQTVVLQIEQENKGVELA